MDKKVFRKANSISSKMAGDGLNVESRNGRVIIKGASVSEEENLYGRSLIQLPGREAEEDGEPREASSEDNSLAEDRKKLRKRVAGGLVVAGTLATGSASAKLVGNAARLAAGRRRKNSDSPEENESEGSGERDARRRERAGGRKKSGSCGTAGAHGTSKSIRSVGTGENRRKNGKGSGPVALEGKDGLQGGSEAGEESNWRRGAFAREYGRLSRGGVAGRINDGLAYAQRRVYLAGKKTLRDDSARIARVMTFGRMKGKKDSEGDGKESSKIIRKNGLNGKKKGKRDGKGKRRKGSRILRGAGRLVSGSYRSIGFGAASNEGRASDEMASRMSMAVMLFIKFFALSLLVLNIIAKLLLLIVTAIICIIIVVVVNVTLISIIVAIIAAIVVAILALIVAKSMDDDDDDGGGGGTSYVRYHTIDEAFQEVEEEYRVKLEGYLSVSGYAGYRIEGEKASFHDVMEVWLALGEFEGDMEVWVSPENLNLLKSIYWEFNHIEYRSEMKMVPETITYTDANGNIHEVEVMVGKRIAVITATAKTKEEVMEAFGLTSTINLIRPVQQQRAEAIYVTKIQGKEYELPVGEVMLEE